MRIFWLSKQLIYYFLSWKMMTYYWRWVSFHSANWLDGSMLILCRAYYFFIFGGYLRIMFWSIWLRWLIVHVYKLALFFCNLNSCHLLRANTRSDSISFNISIWIHILIWWLQFFFIHDKILRDIFIAFHGPSSIYSAR